MLGVMLQVMGGGGFSFTNLMQNLDQWGFFTYFLPFLLIFAVTYGILSKIKVFQENNAVNAIIAVAIGLLALQLDFVSTFFMEIFPKFAMGLAIILVLVILLGFFFNGTEVDKWKEYSWIGWVVGIAVILWALSTWRWGADNYGIGSWFETNFWAILIGILIGVAIYFITKKSSTSTSGTTK